VHDRLEEAWEAGGLRLLQAPSYRYLKAARLRLCDAWPTLREVSLERRWQHHLQAVLAPGPVPRGPWLRTLLGAAAAPAGDTDRLLLDELTTRRIAPALRDERTTTTGPILVTGLPVLLQAARLELLSRWNIEKKVRA
jgi:hypothetical protein